MKENAIRVSDHYEKICLEFGNYTKIKEDCGFKRLYTIHTASTNALSDKLGFHIIGFCDERGTGGPGLAANLAGYEELPSDLILCRTDKKYDYLPLTPSELECLYTYLTTGKVIPTSREDEAIFFFEKHRIHPIVPELNIPMKPVFFFNYKKVVALAYDESLLKDEKQREEYDRLLDECKKKAMQELTSTGLYWKSSDGRYYVDWFKHDEHFYWLVQAVNPNDEDDRRGWLIMAQEMLKGNPPWAQNPHIDDD